MFYILTENEEERRVLLSDLKQHGVYAVFHYLSLHESSFFKDKHDGRRLVHCNNFMNSLIRLPFYFELKHDEVIYICNKIKEFYRGK
jgi:dTDP-4-amino-4,6-dideoxygalactose transaminase